MKKSIWTLSALALLGLGLAGCGGEDGDSCTKDADCDTTKGYTCDMGSQTCKIAQGPFKTCEQLKCEAQNLKCVLVAGDDKDTKGFAIRGCAAKAQCDAGQIFEIDDQDPTKALCVSAEKRVTCVKDSDCESSDICKDNKCQAKSNNTSDQDYKFVRIDDLSETDGHNLDDPGADIDAVALIKGGKAPIWATAVKGYKRADGKSSSPEFKTATNPQNALGAPDSIIGYPNNVTGCNYYKAPYNKDTTKNEHPYVSLGGLGGYLELEMGDKIEANDKLDILEVGDCKLKNTKDINNDPAKSEKIKVQISISGEDGSWKSLGQSKATNGVVTFNILQDHVQKPSH